MKRWLWILCLCLLKTFPVAAVQYTADTRTEVRIPYAQNLNEEMLYYMFEWGDGTCSPSSLKRSGIQGFMEHQYVAAGTYTGRFCAVSMSGARSEWTPFSVAVTAVEKKKTGRQPIQSAAVMDNRGALSGISAAALDWSSELADTYSDRKWVGVELDDYYALDQLVLTKASGKDFPTHFMIEYSINRGKTWHKLNSAQFYFLPDPGTQKVTIEFNGLAANAVRLISTRIAPDAEGRMQIHLGSFQLTGSKDLLFDCSERGPVIAGLNNMWYAFGSAVNEVRLDYQTNGQSKRPFECGVSYMGNAEWMAWDALEMSWQPSRDLNVLRAKWLDYPLDKDGFVWACPGDPRHLFNNRHYDNNACYISGIAHYCLQTGDKAFLQHTCAVTGLTNLEKVRLAMRYQLEQLGGTNGVLTITDPEVDGTPGSKSGNYWDYYKFGYQSAFDNAGFYQSLLDMAELERFCGESKKAAEYEAIAAKVKQTFNELFWNEETGRYIGCIDAKGVRRDYGFTFVNLHALAYGLADEAHARKILDWLDGERIIAGEKSAGEDIYHFKMAPRANTVDMADVKPLWVETWGGALNPDDQGRYGMQIQNGGTIFYTSYYDLHSRLRYQGIDGAMRRLNVIAGEFEKDELRRMDSNHIGHTLMIGVLLCFPESGLVPMFYVDGIMGLHPEDDGLLIRPALPEGWQWVAVNSYWFSGREYSIRADRTAKEVLIRQNGTRMDITVPAAGTFVLTAEGKIVAKEAR